MHAFATVAVLVAGLLSTSALAQTTYELCSIGLLSAGPSFSDALDINDLGHAVGNSTAPGATHGFFWDRSNGTRSLGTLPGDSFSLAQSINNRDEVTGVSSGIRSRAYVWRKLTGMQPLQDPSDPFQPGFGIAINDLGEIVGQGNGGAYIWDRLRGVRPLEPIADFSFIAPFDINNFGKVLAFGSAPGHAGFFILDARSLQQRDLPLELASAVNLVGQVAGSILIPDPTTSVTLRAALWDRVRGLQDLGDLPGGGNSSEANDVNDLGTVVGTSSVPQSAHGFVWTRRTGMRDLNDMVDRSGADAQFIEIRSGEAINNFGWIAANGLDLRDLSSRRAFVLIPRLQLGQKRSLCGQ